MKICIGIPSYGGQTKEWWQPLVGEVAGLSQDGIEMEQLISVSGMSVDFSRNAIVDEFLKTKAEWLMWLDADNTIPSGAIKRLLSTHRTLITGVYVKRSEKNPEPVVYMSTPDGMYQAVEDWERGEILPVDNAGMGGCLTHRSVFDDIEKNYRVLERVLGGVVCVHKDEIEGDIFDEVGESDGRVVAGVLQDRLRIPKYKHPFPYFMIAYGRTEDYPFFEMAKKSGHQLFVDTSVELGHVGVKIHKPTDWLMEKV